MTLTVRHVHTNYCAQSWPYVEEFIAAAHKFGHGDYSMDQIKMFVTMGQWVLLAAVDENEKVHGACTIAFQNYPNDRIAFITAMGGKLITSKDTFSQLKDIAKSMGATKIQGASRESAARLWKRFGLTERSIIVETKI